MHNNLTTSFQKPVFFDYNGSFDDFVALVTLLTLDKYRLSGITLSNSIYPVELTTEITRYILNLFCRYDITIARSNAAVLNPFLVEERVLYDRYQSIKIEDNGDAGLSETSNEDAIDFMAHKILAEKENTVIMLSGSAVNLSLMFKRYPATLEKIEKILWAAGAFLADGNVVAPDHDGSAEWNVFMHPLAASDLLETGLPLYLFPLDASSLLPVDNYLMYHLGKHKKKQLSKLVFQLFKYDYDLQNPIYMNSVLPAVYLGIPEIFDFETKSIKIEQWGTSMGNIYRTSLGERIKHVSWVNDEIFYDFLIKQFKQF